MHVIASSTRDFPAVVLNVPRKAPERTMTAEPMPADTSFGEASADEEAASPGAFSSWLDAHNGGDDSSEFGALAYGTSRVSFSDSRLPGFTNPSSSSGKLFMRFSASWYVCSATLIGRSLLLIAAHCVFDYGANSPEGGPMMVDGQVQVYFAPAYKNGIAPYGVWWAQSIAVPDPYYAGTDTQARSRALCATMTSH